MLVSEAVGKALAEQGVRVVFGLLGSGNLTVTNALRDAGAAFVAARHETSAVCMSDGYARVSGEVAACSVHQGPGLTNAITGLTEAAKSRTPLVLLAADTPAAALRSNFRIDQAGLVEAVGAVAGATAAALVAALEGPTVEGRPAGFRSPALAEDIRDYRWRNERFEESRAALDPRTFSIVLDELLPDDRCVVVDSGHFMGWPSMYMRVPDAAGFVFPQAFQCV